MAGEFVQCVNGKVSPAEMGICDAHNHLWIEKIAGSYAGVPVLDDEAAIANELESFKRVGGGSIVDCQPGGCGRDGRRLRSLSKISKVQIVACTGFHLPRYYPSDYWLYSSKAGRASAYFITELTRGLRETTAGSECVLAGFIKIACQTHLEDTSPALLEAAAEAACEVGCAIEMHTEKGEEAERYAEYFLARGLPPGRLVICHIDKRPDFGLHSELAQQGIVLEYDTFYRSKYNPEQNLWPLIEKMLAGGWGCQVALATDMAEANLWSAAGGFGLSSFVQFIRPRLEAMGASPEQVTDLLGANITRCLARSK